MIINGQPIRDCRAHRLGRRLSRARRPACARPRLHGRGRSRRQQRGHRAEPRILATTPWRPPGRARHDAHHRRRAPDGDRRDASRLHGRRSESRLPDSLRSDAGAASRGARPRQFVRHRAPARGCLVRAGVQRDAEHLRRARERGAAAQCPPDGDALSAAGTDGRGAPAGAVSRWWARSCSCCSWPASTSRICCWRAAPRASASSACARRLAPDAAGWCARCSPRAWSSRPPAASRGWPSRRCVIAACSRWWAIAFRFRGSTRWRSICRWSRSPWSPRWRPASSLVSCPRSSRRATRAMRCAKAGVTAAAADCTACSARSSSPKWRCRSCCWPAPAC